MTRKRGGRKLTTQEEKIWLKVAESTSPLAKPKPSAAFQKRAAIEPSKPTDRFPEPIPEFRIGEKAVKGEAAPYVLQPAPVRMDQKAFNRLKRGRLQPEARLDLHGMTQAAAHSALTAFILRAKSDGKRLVLVITGKGRSKGRVSGPMPEQPGILRRQVPHWLETPPLNQMVLQIAPAHQKHGGSGALYVYLRRR